MQLWHPVCLKIIQLWKLLEYVLFAHAMTNKVTEQGCAIHYKSKTNNCTCKQDCNTQH